MNFDEMKASDIFATARTEEGKAAIKNALKETLEANKELSATIGEGAFSLFKVLSNAGVKIMEHKEELFALADFVEKIGNMPEHEAKEYLETLFNEAYEGREVSEEEKNEIIVQIYRKPENLTQLLPKAVEKIFDGKTDLTEPTGINVAPRNKKPVVVNTQVFVSIMTNEGIQMPKTLTNKDREVFHGICSILESGQTTFTARQVYEAYAGKSTTSPQALGAVTKSIRKMMMSLISIDWTEHARMNGLNVSEDDSIQTETNMINLECVKIISNGQEVRGYKVIKPPALYTYSKAIGQICTIDKKLLNIPTISNTDQNILLKNSLLRKIERMKNKHTNYNRVILFETLTEECDLKYNTKDSKKNIRDKVFMILDYWKNSGYIQDYLKKKSGKEFKGIEIIL